MARNDLTAALALLDATDPETIDAIRQMQEDEAAAKAKKRAAIAEKRAKVEAKVASRAEALLIEYDALMERARQEAAEGLARAQLEQEAGLGWNNARAHLLPDAITARVGFILSRE